MPDISMCVNSECGLRSTCYRYMAEPKPRCQSYSHFHPSGKNYCVDHLEIYPEDRLQDLSDADESNKVKS